jgi:hypothetical protein
VSKPALGVLVGTVLGILDGASAWAYPEARPMMVAIVVGSTIKGAATGLVAGLVARRVRSLSIGIVVGLAVGCLLSILAAANAPSGPDGSQPYIQIVLPGMLLGAVVGFVTQRFPKTAQPSNPWTSVVLAFVMCAGFPPPFAVCQQDTRAEDPFLPVVFLLGTWRGTSSGQPGDGTVEREYSRALNGRFIQVRNRSVYPPQERNKKGEIHEDWGFLSFDRTRRRFVLRQFHVEGFVNQYVADPAPSATGAWVFTSEAIENIPAGWRARETYITRGPDELEEIFELAEPGKDFQVYSRTRLKRVP